MVIDEVNSHKKGRWMKRRTVLEVDDDAVCKEGSAPEFKPAVKRLALELEAITPTATYKVSRRRSRIVDDNNNG